MAVNRDPILKKCRSLGIDPIYLGINKTSNKQPQKARRARVSEYGLQLKEKQKVKFYYGVLEKQFRKYYEEANRKEGVTGVVMLSFLERRLDNVVFRLGFASTRRQARQMVSHAMFNVNGKKVNIASFRVKVGDVIEVRENKRKIELFTKLKDAKVVTPKWLKADLANLKGEIIANPEREDIDLNISEHLIIEHYSK